MPSPPSDELLTSRQACQRLGVKPQTLYAYVARGIIRSERTDDGGRGRRYSSRELDALVARRRSARDPRAAAERALFWGMPVVRSAVSFAGRGRLLYRGHAAVELAERVRFEQAAELLWTGQLPRAAQDWPAIDGCDVAGAAKVAADAVGDAPPFCAMQVIVAALGPSDGARFDLSERGVTATARRMLARVVAVVAAARGGQIDAACRGPLAARVLTALGAGRAVGDVGAVRLVDRALILSAEHELNASTFAARVAASTGADPYAVVCAAVAALSGPKHGGVTERVEALAREVRAGRGGAARALARRSALGEPIPGFGHPLYPHGDPRAPPLLAAACAWRGRASGRVARRRAADLDAVLAIVDAMAAHDRPHPTLDVALVATACALGLRPGSAALLFAFGRMAGWIAHTLEQYAMDALIRPRAQYVGPASGT